jgi:hypothetical protein
VNITPKPLAQLHQPRLVGHQLPVAGVDPVRRERLQAGRRRDFFLDDKGRMWFGSPANDRVGYFYLAK